MSYFFMSLSHRLLLVTGIIGMLWLLTALVLQA